MQYVPCSPNGYRDIALKVFGKMLRCSIRDANPLALLEIVLNPRLIGVMTENVSLNLKRPTLPEAPLKIPAFPYSCPIFLPNKTSSNW